MSDRSWRATRLTILLLALFAVTGIVTGRSEVSARVPAPAPQEAAPLAAIPINQADVNCDRAVDIRDALYLRLMVAGLETQISGCSADANRSSGADASDALYVLRALAGLVTPAPTPPTFLESSSPLGGEGAVAVTRETILQFSQPLKANSISASSVSARFGQKTLTATRHLSADGTRLTMFFTDPLPPNARVRITINGELLQDIGNGKIDGDGDGVAGGVGTVDFETQSLTTIEGTQVCGYVLATEKQNGQDVPLVGVTIMVEGMEQVLRTTTGNDGAFCLNPAPTGTFFALIDGRAATKPVPTGAYYPYVGKPWTSIAGEAVNIGTVYLPLVAADALKPVSGSQNTVIGLPNSVLATQPELAGVQVNVPAGSLYGDDGSQGGKIGLAMVAPDRLPSPLPPGFNAPVVITVQSDGATNFDIPVSACFPNLPLDGAPLPQPGDKSALISFNHDSGRWEVGGSMTVNADGTLVCTDPGVGIRQPGWHGTRPLRQFNGGPVPPPNDCPPPPPNGNKWKNTLDGEKNKWKYGGGAAQAIFGDAANAATGNMYGAQQAASAAAGTTGSINSQINTATSVASSIGDFAGLPSLPFAMVASGLNLATAAAEAISEALSGCPSSLQSAFLEQSSVSQQQVQDQLDLLNRYSGLLAVLFGTNALAEIAPEDLEAADGFYQALVAAIKQDGPSGAVITDAEANALRAAPQPPPLSTSLVNSMIANWNAWANGSAPQGQIDAAVAAGEDLGAILDKVVSLGWTTPYETIAQMNADIAPDLHRMLGLFEEWPEGPVYYRVQSGDSDFVIRGVTHPSALLPSTLVEAESGSLIEYLDPRTLQIARVYIRGGSPGTVMQAPLSVFVDPLLPDSDGDGLSDDGEDIVGTGKNDADSDGDGIADGAELQQGSDPLDGIPVRTGIIATSATTGPANGVCAGDGLVAVAQGNTGVGLFLPYTGAANLTSVGTFDTPGAGQAVACTDGAVLVADGTSGVAILETEDAPASFIRKQIPLLPTVTRVAVGSSGIGYAVHGTKVTAFDISNGSLQDTLTIPGDVHDISIADGRLYVVTIDRLYVYSELPFGLQLLGDVAVGGSSGSSPHRSLFAGPGYVYVGLPTGQFAGYVVVNVSNPAAPAVVGQASTQAATFFDITANGSGILLGANGFTGIPTREVGVYDATDPANVMDLVVAVQTPGQASALSIDRGFAYLADGGSGLSVVNYVSFDTGGSAPTATAASSAIGNAIDENQSLVLKANVSDDVQVREVEFLVDGEVVATDGSFPFEHTILVPPRSQKTSLTIRVRATDTGGNSTLSAPLVIAINNDTTPPTVRNTAPGQGRSLAPGTLTAVTVFMSEPISAATVTNSTFRLFTAGPDAIPGNGDDVLVNGGGIALAANNTALRLVYPADLPGGSYRGVVSGNIADIKGNALGDEFSWTFQVAAGDIIDPGSFVEFSGSLDSPGTEDFFEVTGTAGQILYFEVVDVRDGSCTASGGAIRMTVRRPDDTTLVNGALATFCADQGPFTLTQSGDYSIRLYSEGNFTGNYVLRVWSVPATPVIPIALDQVVSDGVPSAGAGSIDVPGAKDSFTFQGTAGQIVYFDSLGVNGECGGTTARWTVQEPDDSFIFNGVLLGFCGDWGPVTLAATGTYRITVHAGSLNMSGDPSTFVYSFVVRSVPPTQQFAIDRGDVVSPDSPSAGAGNIDMIGAKDQYTFSAAAGDIVYFDSLGVNGVCNSSPDARWTIQEPDGTFLLNAAQMRFCNDYGPYTLEATGEYKITVHAGSFLLGNNTDTFTYSFVARVVPATQQFDINLDETVDLNVPATGAGNIDAIGAKDAYTLTVDALQIVYFDVLSVNGTCNSDPEARWTIQNPDGTFLLNAAQMRFCNDYGPFTLEAAGDYTITVHSGSFTLAGNPDTFTYSFIARAVPPDQVFPISAGTTITPGSPAGAGRIEVPGAKDVYTFTVGTSTSYVFDVQPVCPPSDARWTLQFADGTIVPTFSASTMGNCLDKTLTLQPGNYRLTVHAGSLIQSNNPATFDYSFQFRPAP